MRDRIDCEHAEELFSDHLEGTLPEPLESEVAKHLSRCPRCGELFEALHDVVAVLRASSVTTPAPELAERAAAAALAARREAGRAANATLPWPVRLSPLPIAAALAAALGAAALLARPDRSALEPARRLAVRTDVAREYLLERKERLVGSIERLGVLIETALEVRLDGVNDRLDEYRRWQGHAGPDHQRQGASAGRASISVCTTALRTPEAKLS
jgi:anti-sigma factor RsiW